MKKAEMGIGTLIIFIAMILVAAIAAGVILETASTLQNKALDTGQKSKGQISTTLMTILLYAENGSTGELDDFYIKAKLAPGAEPLKISEMLLSMDLVNQSADLVYGGIGCAKPSRNSTGQLINLAGSGAFYTYRSSDVAKGNGTLGKGNFTVKYLLNSMNHKDGYLQRGDIIQFCFEAPRTVEEDEKFAVKIIPKVGTPLYIESSTPDIITQQRVMIYP